MQLKPYQSRSLDALRTFLDAAAVKPRNSATRAKISSWVKVISPFLLP